MVPDELGFLYPSIDQNACINCGLCERACPVENSDCYREEYEEKAYAVKCRDPEIRMNSSSGGAFSLLGQKVIEDGGVVYGAVLNDQLHVSHAAAESPAELLPIRGSKIIQSSPGLVYKEIEQRLKNGEKVLFSGTPCQVSGLLRFLGRRYDNLITQDIICHGVCSLTLYDRYISYLQEKHGCGIQTVRFRDKETGWRDYSVSITYDNGDKTVVPHGKDELMRAYLKNYALRPSCYKCPFKGKKRASDITLADFWGAEHFVSELDDDQGISFVITHSSPGDSYIRSILPGTDSRAVNYEKVIKYNMSGEVSSPRPSDNDAFCRDLSEKPFRELINKYCRITIKSKIKRAVKSVLKLH